MEVPYIVNTSGHLYSGFVWDRVSFPSSNCVVDLVCEEY